MTSRTGSTRGGFWGFWRKLVELRTRHWTRRVDFWGSLRRDEFARYGHRTRLGGGGRWKSQNRKNVYLSPYVETFNSKVIKGFVPELRSRKCFCLSRIPMFYVYMLWTLYVHFTYPYPGNDTHVLLSISIIRSIDPSQFVKFSLYGNRFISLSLFLSLSLSLSLSPSHSHIHTHIHTF